MKRFNIILAVILVSVAALFFIHYSLSQKRVPNQLENKNNQNDQESVKNDLYSKEANLKQDNKENKEKKEDKEELPKLTETKHPFTEPIDKNKERVTKKPFGIYITPETSPVKDDKFKGFHTGIDLEVFLDELNQEVEIKAICSGELLLKQNISGYGGVVIQLCELDNEPITVLYGHLSLASISKNKNDLLRQGSVIGVLGKDKSFETDGARKHLHLGIHKGANIEFKGYVNQEEKLNNWIDPCLYICK